MAALAAVGAITLGRVAQDGMRVRADAGAASFRRQASLDEHLSQARALVQTIKTQAQADPGQAQRQAQAAKRRAAQEREARIQAALEQLPAVAAAKQRNGGKAEDARASTTDADVRVMKMGDGGFRPAFNVQFATTCGEQVIVGMGAQGCLGSPHRVGSIGGTIHLCGRIEAWMEPSANEPVFFQCAYADWFRVARRWHLPAS